MRHIKKKQKANAHFFFSHLLNTLQRYEGESLYFKDQNALFISYLRARFEFFDEEKEGEALNLLTNHHGYFSHPFLPTIIKLISGGLLTEKEKTLVLNEVKNHPHYPLADFLLFVLGDRNKVRKTDDLILLYALSHPSILEAKISLESIAKKLIKKGYTYALITLIERYFKQDDAKALFSFLEDNLPLQVINRRQTITRILLSEYLKAPKESTFAGEILTKCVELGNEEALLPLVNYYEMQSNLGRDSLAYSFFYLFLAASKNNKEALLRLSVYYEKGLYIPKNLSLANDLKNRAENINNHQSQKD